MKYHDLVDGTMVMMPSDNNNKYILHNGWYKYDGTMQFGWYGISIETGNVYPLSLDDIKELIPIDESNYPPRPWFPPGPCPPPPPPGPWPPRPCPPPPYPPRPEVKSTNAFNIADELSDLDTIPKRHRFDGMIVRVLDDGTGNPANYEWNSTEDKWVTVLLDGSKGILWEQF